MSKPFAPPRGEPVSDRAPQTGEATPPPGRPRWAPGRRLGEQPPRSRHRSPGGGVGSLPALPSGCERLFLPRAISALQAAGVPAGPRATGTRWPGPRGRRATPPGCPDPRRQRARGGPDSRAASPGHRVLGSLCATVWP